tara:strand:- start:4561 stop:4746 length:186 start_codon:yes stop_codon:yes gene_type:complete
MITINFTDQEMIELLCLIDSSKEFKMTKEIDTNNYSKEELQMAEKHLMPLFTKLGMYKKQS